MIEHILRLKLQNEFFDGIERLIDEKKVLIQVAKPYPPP